MFAEGTKLDYCVSYEQEGTAMVQDDDIDTAQIKPEGSKRAA